MVRHIYTSLSKARKPVEIGRSMIAGLINSKYIAYRLFLKDVKGDYSRTSLGILWDLADPLMLGMVFYFLRRSAVISGGEIAIPYTLFIIYGILLYQTFVDATMSSLSMYERSKSLITQLSIPPEALILSPFLKIYLVALARSSILHST